MAHKTMVDGTAYDISGGKTMVGGTVYGIDKGKTMVDGTVREVGFGPNIIPVSITKGASIYNEGTYKSYAYIEFGNGKTCIVGEYEMERGAQFTAAVKGKTSSGGSSSIYLNGEKVAGGTQSSTMYTYSFVPDCNAIEVTLVYSGSYTISITTK